MRNPSKFWGIEAEMRHCCCRVHLGSSAIRNAARAAVLHSFFLFFGGHALVRQKSLLRGCCNASERRLIAPLR